MSRAAAVLERLMSKIDPRAQALLRDEDGAVYVEYIVLTLFVGIGFSAAVMAIGVPLLESFRMTQIFLAVPIP
ncbi:MAG: hypothetical protein GXP55_04355 [Deltaproteobacteria bacterium]|nr:hypothetical protein [Deltaproteobacteria bacterium]